MQLLPSFFRSSNKVPVVQSKRVTTARASVGRIRQDAATRQAAINEAEQMWYPFRTKMQKLYLNTRENGHIKACIEKRKDLTMLRKWEFKNAVGEIDQAVTDIFCYTINDRTMKKKWFTNFISYCLDKEFYGYSLIYLGNVINGEFINTEVERRWLVSPDRYTYSPYENMMSGQNFITDPELKDCYVYVSTPNEIGTSPCGYGMFYELSLYEIVMRNLLSFNADYVEVNVAPFREVKTNKTEEAERAELLQAAIDIASNGVFLSDPEDELILHAANGGTGYHAFDLLEKRLEDKCSQVILGHADAIKSVPGKLGNDNEESPAQQAMEDKQSKDGEEITAIVNKVLFARMRALGFSIPEGTTASMVNDNEDVENANKVIGQAVEMKKGGLQIEAKYFTEMTKIPVEAVQTVKPTDTAKITNRLIEMYG